MKVLHTITGLQIGGAETVLYRLLSVIAQNETDTHRVVCLGPSGPIAEKISQTGIRVYHLHGTGRLSAPTSVSAGCTTAISQLGGLRDIQNQEQFGIFDTQYQIYPENGRALAL